MRPRQQKILSLSLLRRLQRLLNYIKRLLLNHHHQKYQAHGKVTLRPA